MNIIQTQSPPLASNSRIEASQLLKERLLKVFSTDFPLLLVQTWDTAGQEQYRAVTGIYYRGAAGAFVVYDIADRSTFEDIPSWLEELHQHTDEDIVMLLVGNKCDLHHARQVTIEEGQEFAKKNQMLFIETSAQDNVNINQAFDLVTQEIFKLVSSEKEEGEQDEIHVIDVQNIDLTSGNKNDASSSSSRGKNANCCVK